ncbi:hypothetical protein PHJA_002235500 [Phtheirospermum japonicum]|uniref:Uncharacterized protein n=1 Tax=Phtheirospermum japonicum TaxID=374723 RepID=A0A830D112_9LAMI|nr:hypothetical protein PHJA_002235500 [Phtheirospermum japonicum]
MVVRCPPCFAAAKRTPPSQPSKKTQRQNSTQGFGGKKKDPVWQCIQNCGACCKLDKGPTFPSAEEIFDEPSDIESVLIFAELSQRFLIHYMGLTRKNSTRRLAVGGWDDSVQYSIDRKTEQRIVATHFVHMFLVQRLTSSFCDIGLGFIDKKRNSKIHTQRMTIYGSCIN